MEKEDKRHYNAGGKRPGAGRPFSERPKKVCTFRMDIDVESILNDVKNKEDVISTVSWVNTIK